MEANHATFSLIIAGIDYAETIVPRLMSLTLTEKLEGEADDLEIQLANHDGALPTIKRGVKAKLALGWIKGDDVTLGLVDKGTFTVDEVRKEGGSGNEIDTLTIRARSADLTGNYRNRRNKAWKDKTIGQIVGDIAGANGYEAQVHPDLADIKLPSVEQSAKSDMAFIRDLGRRHDAVATVKDGKLLFTPIGAQTNPGGKAMASHKLTRRENSRWTFTVADRQEHDGAEAQWHDRKAARRKTVKQGGGKNPKRIKRSFASEAEAKAAASAESKRASRGQYEFTYDMALGEPAIGPNERATLSGWDDEIDGIKWLIEQATHKLDAQGGLGTSLMMKSVT